VRCIAKNNPDAAQILRTQFLRLSTDSLREILMLSAGSVMASWFEVGPLRLCESITSVCPTSFECFAATTTRDDRLRVDRDLLCLVATPTDLLPMYCLDLDRCCPATGCF